MIARGIRKGVLAGALLLGVGGCTKDVDYGYVSVTVSLAENTTPYYLSRVRSCGVNVYAGQDSLDFAPLACRSPANSTDLGTFEWSTVSAGAVRFVVSINDAEGPIGKGESGPVNVVLGSTVAASVIVTPDATKLTPPTPGQPDAGLDGAGAY